MTIGWLQAVAEAIGESDNEIGGLFITRLTSVVNLGDTTFNVETTVGWGAEGMMSIDGVIYYYTGKTATTFTGITYLDDGAEVVGARQDHRPQSDVIDASQSRSAVDLVRRALLVEYAVKSDLSVLGNNLGVPRQPILGNDDRYREVIKALAYNPRGTLYGIKLALDALVGPDNYEVFEDLTGPADDINYPCTVFINLLQIPEAEYIGKTFFNEVEDRPAQEINEVDLTGDPLRIYSVRWKDAEHTTDLMTQLPTAETWAEYTGETPKAVWTLTGTAWALTNSAYTGYNECTFTTQGYYYHRGRIMAESTARLTASLYVGAATIEATDGRSTALVISCSERLLGVGIFHVNASTYRIGFMNPSTGALVGTGTVVDKSVYHEVSLVKNGTGLVELWINGSRVETAAYTSFPGGAGHEFQWGRTAAGATSPGSRIKNVSFYCSTATDYWNARNAYLVPGGSVATGSPTVLDTNGDLTYVAADIGRHVRISGGTTSNGRNNGVFVVASGSGDTLTLQGRPLPGVVSVDALNPTRVTVDRAPGVFKFPQDIGKKFTITGSEGGVNDGTWVIAAILDPDTLDDLADLDTGTQIYAQSNVIEVTGATFETESGLSGRLDPNFVTESGLTWELADASSYADPTITLRQNLPITSTPWNGRIMTVCYSTVLSAQLLEDIEVKNSLVDEGPPPVYAYYPAYLSDPLGSVRHYIDTLTAAGVIADYQIT